MINEFKIGAMYVYEGFYNVHDAETGTQTLRTGDTFVLMEKVNNAQPHRLVGVHFKILTKEGLTVWVRLIPKIYLSAPSKRWQRVRGLA